MQATIEPGSISGIIAAPPSKSMTQRAYAAALLNKGNTTINNAGHSDDERAALQVIQQLGVDVVHLEGVQHLTSSGVKPSGDGINCGESGLAARLFTPIAALSDKAIKIDGRESLLQRPMDGFPDVLPQLGVELTGFNGYLPFTVKGPMQAGDIMVDASSGSQFLSGLLFALCSCAKEAVTLTVKNLKSKPYIDMTLEMLAYFGMPVTHKEYEVFFIDPAAFVQKENIVVNVEGDWSSAAYFLVAGAIAGDITVQCLNINSSQADKVIIDVMQMAGADITITGSNVSVRRGRLKAFEFDATDCPDLFPVLSILAACCDGESYIKGVHRLFHKESNRAESISEMLQNFDVPFSMEDDVFCITGVKKLQGTVIDTYGDHRIAMAASIAALRAGSRVDINGAESVNKSYPAFFDDLVMCGGKCKFTPDP